MRNALADAINTSFVTGLPATWGQAPSPSGIFSDLFGIARPTGQVVCWDWAGNHYLCKVYEIGQRPEIARAVYMFAERIGDSFRPDLIGLVKSSEEGAPAAEHFTAAAGRGCTHVLVYDAPTIFADLEEAAKRLVATFEPKTNKAP